MTLYIDKNGDFYIISFECLAPKLSVEEHSGPLFQFGERQFVFFYSVDLYCTSLFIHVALAME